MCIVISLFVAIAWVLIGKIMFRILFADDNGRIPASDKDMETIVVLIGPILAPFYLIYTIIKKCNILRLLDSAANFIARKIR